MGSEKYIMIYDWMLQLGLNPSELLAFGLVFRYTSHGQKLTARSETYSEWLGLHPVSAWKVMDKLCKKGLIVKTDIYNGSVHRCEYSVAPRFAINKTLTATINETLTATINETLMKNENKNKKEEKTATPSLYDLARMSNVKN